MVKCTFCGKELVKGTGTMFVYKSGKIVYFCSMKCEKSMLKLKRSPRTQKWVTSFGNKKA